MCKAVVPAVPGVFLQKIWKGEGCRLLLSWSQTIPPFQIRMRDTEPCMGANREQTWLLGADDPQAAVSSLERSQVHPLDCMCFPTCNLVPLLPSSHCLDSLKWGWGKRRRKVKI